jgi:hypothetical protein
MNKFQDKKSYSIDLHHQFVVLLNLIPNLLMNRSHHVRRAHLPSSNVYVCTKTRIPARHLFCGILHGKHFGLIDILPLKVFCMCGWIWWWQHDLLWGWCKYTCVSDVAWTNFKSSHGFLYINFHHDPTKR